MSQSKRYANVRRRLERRYRAMTDLQWDLILDESGASDGLLPESEKGETEGFLYEWAESRLRFAKLDPRHAVQPAERRRRGPAPKRRRPDTYQKSRVDRTVLAAIVSTAISGIELLRDHDNWLPEGLRAENGTLWERVALHYRQRTGKRMTPNALRRQYNRSRGDLAKWDQPEVMVSDSLYVHTRAAEDATAKFVREGLARLVEEARHLYEEQHKTALSEIRESVMEFADGSDRAKKEAIDYLDEAPDWAAFRSIVKRAVQAGLAQDL